MFWYLIFCRLIVCFSFSFFLYFFCTVIATKEIQIENLQTVLERFQNEKVNRTCSRLDYKHGKLLQHLLLACPHSGTQLMIVWPGQRRTHPRCLACEADVLPLFTESCRSRYHRADTWTWRVRLLYLLHSFTHSLVDLPRWGLATADDHSDIFLLHCARSCDISFSWMYSQPVHSSMSCIHCLLGLHWCRDPSMIPSRTVSANCPALPRVMWPKYCSFQLCYSSH